MNKLKKLINLLSAQVIFKRIFSIKKGIFFYLTASFVDLISITIISKIFSILTSSDIEDTLPFYTFIFISTIILRTYIVFILRKYGSLAIINNKSQIESNIVQKFVSNRIRLKDKEDEVINTFKENLINSTLTAAVNFDLPVISFIGELFFALGGILFIIKTLGLGVFLINFPLFFILVIFTRYLSKKLYRLGTMILKATEDRLNVIDNTSEISLELSAQKTIDPLVRNFSNINNNYNYIFAKQIYNQNQIQIVIESSSFLLIFVTLISIISGLTNLTLADSATVLAILSRMVPSITRSFASYAQIQYGIPAIKRLEKLKLNKT